MTTDQRRATLEGNLELVWKQLIKFLASVRFRGSPPNQSACNQLHQVPAEEREQFVTDNWGSPTLEKAKDMLFRISSMEAELAPPRRG